MKGLKTIRKLARWAALAGLFVLVLEVCGRLDDWLTWDAPFVGHYSQALLTVADSLGVHSRPNARFEKWHINSHGFRGPEITMEKPEGVVRVAVIGASETFGLYESPGKDYPAQVQAMLDVVAPGRYQVLNAGCAGMSFPRFTFYFRNWISKFDPDVVLVYPMPANYVSVQPPKAKFEVRQGPPRKLKESLRLERKVRIVLKRFIPASVQRVLREFLLARELRRYGPDWEWQEVPPERVELFREHLAALVHEVRKTGAQVVLATHATRFPKDRQAWTEKDRMLMLAWRKFYIRATSACLLGMEDAANRVVVELGERDGMPVADIASIVPRTGENFADFSHFTDRGAEIAASAIVKQILGMRPAGQGRRP